MKDLIEILWVSIPTLYKIFSPSGAIWTASTVLGRVNELGLKSDRFTLLKVKLHLFLFAVINSEKKDAMALYLELTELKVLKDNIEDPQLKQSVKIEFNFAEAHFRYRLKKRKYINSKNSQISEDLKKYKFALATLKEALVLAEKSQNSAHMVGRISLLECKIFVSIKQETLPPTLMKRLCAAIEHFSMVTNPSRRLELQANFLLAKLHLK